MVELIDRLRELFENEVDTEELLPVPQSIYRDAADYIRAITRISDEREKNVISMLASKERELVYELVRRLLEVRVQKVLSKSFANVDESRLTFEEKYVLEPFLHADRRVKRIRHALRNGQTATLESVANTVISRYMLVRFLKPIPALLGVDLQKHGPFEEENVALLPSENAKALIKKGAAQEIWAEE